MSAPPIASHLRAPAAQRRPGRAGLRPVAAMLAAAALGGCATGPGTVGASREVERFHANLVSAYNACDEKAFVGAYADSVAFTTSNTAKSITTADGIKAYLGYGCRQSPSPQVTLLSQQVGWVGSSAVVTGQYLFRIAGGGGLVEQVQNYTLVVQLEQGVLAIRAHHVSRVP